MVIQVYGVHSKVSSPFPDDWINEEFSSYEEAEAFRLSQRYPDMLEVVFKGNFNI